ncbi:MAG: hypothetical protein R3C03_24355, partial [Pirellulaceae bacterium]
MKILELTLPSTNLDAQQQVFGGMLGFRNQRVDEQPLEIVVGDSVLRFVSAARQFYFHYSFLIPPGCLDSVAAFLDQQGFSPLPLNGQRMVEFACGTAIYFHDGDQNIAEFIERPSLGHKPIDQFSTAEVIRLNEVGIPAMEPRSFAEQLVQQYGIEPMSGAPNTDDFVWCGDFQGAIIVPRVGRNWIPLEKPAELNELSVKFKTSGGKFEFA